jgi:hypothetical protein
MTKPLSRNEMRARAVTFAARWKDETSERGQSQSFWTEFLDIYGVDRKRVAAFEQLAKRTSTGNYGFIDLYWPGVLIAEQKSAGKDLDEAEQQALDYLTEIKQSDFPGLVITSDFARIRILDLEAKDPKPVEIKTADLGKEYERFLFIAGYARQTFEQEIEANVEASELMGQLYDAAEAAGYKDHEANVLLTRLLFLMFGDDTAMWARGLFYSFVHDRTSDDASDLGAQLAMLFQVLNTPETERPKNLDQTLVDFPYVNGGLFSENLRIAAFTPDMRHALIKAMRFGWGGISPAVFGSLFQSVKSKELRRELGEHYTPEKTIMKVIGPLILDELKERLVAAKGSPQKLRNLRKELGTYTFLDPACGCGNFLIVTYREMRRLELEILKQLRDLKEDSQLSLDPTLGLQVSVNQFAGIEIEEWPAKVAETAMFLVDHQMNLELAEEFGLTPDRLPIKDMLNVHVGNALRTDWRSVCEIGDKTLILGNPPFLGMSNLSDEQQQDNRIVFEKMEAGDLRSGRLDYVACWWALACINLQGTTGKAAFVSTNSLTQGEQARSMGPLFDRLGYAIEFAHQTFKWSSDAPNAAAVHVVIIGINAKSQVQKRRLFATLENGDVVEQHAENINIYLTDSSVAAIAKHSTPIVPGPKLTEGNRPQDGGGLIVEPEDLAGVQGDPIAAKYLRKLIAAHSMLHDEARHCLWMVGAEPADLRSSRILQERLETVRRTRAESPTEAARAKAATPYLFLAMRQPKSRWLAVPRVSSDNRPVVPMAFFGDQDIPHDTIMAIDGADDFLFGLLQSRPFTVWAKRVSGRLKSDVRLSPDLSYNSFPAPEPTSELRAQITAAAQEVLRAREAHPGSSLADLYDPLAMPVDLVKAHATLDKAVLASLGLAPSVSDGEVLGALFKRYAELTRSILDSAPRSARKTRKRPDA